MRRAFPQLQTVLFQTGIQRGEVWEVRHSLEQLVTGVPHVLLDRFRRQRARTDGASLARSQPAAGLQISGSKTE